MGFGDPTSGSDVFCYLRISRTEHSFTKACTMHILNGRRRNLFRANLDPARQLHDGWVFRFQVSDPPGVLGIVPMPQPASVPLSYTSTEFVSPRGRIRSRFEETNQKMTWTTNNLYIMLNLIDQTFDIVSTCERDYCFVVGLCAVASHRWYRYCGGVSLAAGELRGKREYMNIPSLPSSSFPSAFLI